MFGWRDCEGWHGCQLHTVSNIHPWVPAIILFFFFRVSLISFLCFSRRAPPLRRAPAPACCSARADRRRPSTPAAPLLHPCRPPRAMLPPRLAPLLKPVDATRAPRCASLRHSWLRRAPLLRLGEPPWSPLLRLSSSHLARWLSPPALPPPSRRRWPCLPTLHRRRPPPPALPAPAPRRSPQPRQSLAFTGTVHSLSPSMAF